MKMLIYSIVLSVPCLLFAACDETAVAEPQDTSPAAAGLAGKWVVQSMTLGGEQVPLKDDISMTISFEGNIFRAKGACNSTSGKFTSAAEGQIQLAGEGWTEIGCEGLDAEAKYAQLLAAAKSFQLKPKQLILSDGSAQNKIVFVTYQAAKPLPLAGTKWKLETFEESSGSGDDAVVSATPVLGMAPITLMINDDKANGSAGCNRYFGKATVKEDKLTFGPMALTRKACRPDINRQEQKYTNWLQKMSSYEISGNKLRLSNGDGTKVLHFTAAAGADDQPADD